MRKVRRKRPEQPPCTLGDGLRCELFAVLSIVLCVCYYNYSALQGHGAKLSTAAPVSTVTAGCVPGSTIHMDIDILGQNLLPLTGFLNANTLDQGQNDPAIVATAHDCCTECSQKQGCNAFTWVKNGQHCWLKTGDDAKLNAAMHKVAGMVSGRYRPSANDSPASGTSSTPDFARLPGPGSTQFSDQPPAVASGMVTDSTSGTVRLSTAYPVAALVPPALVDPPPGNDADGVQRRLELDAMHALRGAGHLDAPGSLPQAPPLVVVMDSNKADSPLALALPAATTVAGKQCAIQLNTDIKGLDLPDASSGGVTDSAEICCNRCQDTRLCAGFTWVENGRHCWLKTGLAAAIADAMATKDGTFSGLKNPFAQSAVHAMAGRSMGGGGAYPGPPPDYSLASDTLLPAHVTTHVPAEGASIPKHDRLFSETITPASDSSCILPAIPVISDYPKVKWIKCNASFRNPTFVTVRENKLLVDCPGSFVVYSGDFRPRLLKSGTEVFHDEKSRLPFDVKSQVSHLKVERDKPDVKTYHNTSAQRPISIAFDSPYVKIECPRLHSVNIRTQYKPEKGRAKPRLQTAKRYSIIHLKVDALSRPSFFRFMKKTAALFQEMWSSADNKTSAGTTSSRYRSFIFNRYVSEQMSTHVNQVPMFSGVTSDAYDVTEVGNPRVWSANVLTLKDNLAEKTRFGQVLKASIDPEWIWQVAYDNGYMVLKDQGMMLSHIFSKTFSTFSYLTTMEWEDSNLLDEKKQAVKNGAVRSQDCLGDEHFQDHYMREAMQFLDTEPTVPKLVIGNSKQAHEKWPYPSQYDALLFDFISALMSRRDDLIIVVAADHGYGFQDQWEKNPKKYPGSDFERLLPFLGLIIPTSLLDQRPSALRNLHANQERLVSHYDIHLTLLNLMRSNPLQEPGATMSRAIPMRQPLGKALDLLASELPTTRDCDGAGILPKSCICVPWTQAPLTSEDAVFAAMRGVSFLNSQRKNDGGACKKIVLGKIVGAWLKEPVRIGYNNKGGQNDRKLQRLVRVEFTGTADTRWQVTVMHDRKAPGPEEGSVVETQTMHRYRPLETCWDESAPLKFCACTPQVKIHVV